MIELWRPIPGYEGFYEAGDLGNIRSLDRRIKYPNGTVQLRKGRMLKQSVGSHGYLTVSLSKEGRPTKYCIHHLVLITFRGSKPGHDCCHNDGNPLNNRLLNLRWDTTSGNMGDKKLHGTHQCGERIHQSKLTEDDIRAIRADSRFERIVAKDYGVTKSNIGCIRRRKTWAHVV